MSGENPCLATGNATSRLQRFCDALKNYRFFERAADVLLSIGTFKRELAKQLTNLTELISKIAEKNVDLAALLYEFEKDVCKIRDFYTRIISRTEALVEFGSKQKLIEDIKKYFEKKSFSEALKELNSFLDMFKRHMSVVNKCIEIMREDCPDLKMVMEKYQKFKKSSDDAISVLQNEMQEVSQKENKVFRLGSTTMICMIAGAATGFVITSYLPKEQTGLKEIITSGGSEVLAFCIDNVLKDLGSIMKESNLTNELMQNIKSNTEEICHHLVGFFGQIQSFEVNINSITFAIKGMEDDIDDLRDDVPILEDGITQSEWLYQIGILNKLCESCKDLYADVINPSKAKNKDFDDLVKKLELISVKLAK